MVKSDWNLNDFSLTNFAQSQISNIAKINGTVTKIKEASICEMLQILTQNHLLKLHFSVNAVVHELIFTRWVCFILYLVW